MQETGDDRSLGELLGDLAQQTATLARQEVELAKTEMSQKAAQVGRDIGFLAVGGAVAYAGFLAILAALIVALAANGVPWWLAALLVGVVVAGIGYVLVQKGLAALRRADLAPRQTIETLKEDKDWAKEQIT
jgi:tetrahydromethanopterin S-methyltransferase subunit G